MDDLHRVSDPHRADVHPAPPGVHPALGRAWRVGARRCAQQPAGRRGDGKQRPRAVLHRGRARWCVFFPFPESVC